MVPLEPEDPGYEPTISGETEISICRVKDRWTVPTSGGWKDMMLNVVIDGVIFEIQVVLTAMLTARKALDAHKAYNRFRCFSEVCALVGVELPTGAGEDEEPQQVAELQSEVARLQGELQEKDAALQDKGAEIARLRKVLADHVAWMRSAASGTPEPE